MFHYLTVLTFQRYFLERLGHLNRGLGRKRLLDPLGRVLQHRDRERTLPPEILNQPSILDVLRGSSLEKSAPHRTGKSLLKFHSCVCHLSLLLGAKHGILLG